MELQSGGPPYYEILIGTDRDFGDFVYRITADNGRDVAIRVIRGQKMKSMLEFHNEFAAAFQFPYYYGENWDAFEECLNDLSWIPAKGYLVCVANASSLLTYAPKSDFDT